MLNYWLLIKPGGGLNKTLRTTLSEQHCSMGWGSGKNKKEKGARCGAHLESQQKQADLHKFQASQEPHIESLFPNGERGLDMLSCV